MIIPNREIIGQHHRDLFSRDKYYNLFLIDSYWITSDMEIYSVNINITTYS